MTWPIVELAFWNPGDPGSPAVDRLLADPATPLVRHGLTGIAEAYARETGAALHDVHREWGAVVTAKSMAVDGSLSEVVPALDRADVPFFVAKGPVVAYTSYPEPGMRPYTDLDVYVPGAWVRRAREALFACGFEPVGHATGVLGGLAQEVHGGRFGAVVEVHAHPVDNIHRRHLPAVEAFLPYVERVALCGVKTPVLSPAAHMAVQAIHLAAAHRYAKLVLLRDLASWGPRLDGVDDLGAGSYYLTARALLDAVLGRPAATEGLVRRQLVRAMVRQTPMAWDEYQISGANVLALLAQPTPTASLWAAGGACRSLLPLRDRRVSIRRRPKAGVAVSSRAMS
jgi:Uncharacterised nucleotidyltransferase